MSTTGIAADAAGNAYLTGWTRGDFARPNSTGVEQIVLASYNPNGFELFRKQFVHNITTLSGYTPPEGYAEDVEIGPSGSIYVAGKPGPIPQGGSNYYIYGLLLKTERFCPCGEIIHDSDGDGIGDVCDAFPDDLLQW